MSLTNLLPKLKSAFGHDKFNSKEQEEAIRTLMKGNEDVLITMPTGSGKSLIYQFPAAVSHNKVTLVISPLLSLIRDQIEHLTKHNIKAKTLNNKVTKSETTKIISDVRNANSTIKLLFVTPERMCSPKFQAMLRDLVASKKLLLVAVDEAHCISSWGTAFRPDYLKLGELRAVTGGGVPWVALTATASSKVAQDIVESLKFREYKTYKLPCFRKNIFYDVKFKTNNVPANIDDLAGFAKSCLGADEELGAPLGSSGIVFCRTRVETESLCIELNKRGVITRAYHAGLEEVERVNVQEQWMAGTVPVITATVSFGMGVDRGPVRFVAHWSVPACISSYYQESGRAGRDGQLSYARLYYSYADRDILSSIMKREIEKADGNRKGELQARLTSFKVLIRYAESITQCRHAIFSCYFGDKVTDCEDACNVCVNPDSALQRLRDFQSGVVVEPALDEDTLEASKAKFELNSLVSRKFRM